MPVKKKQKIQKQKKKGTGALSSSSSSSMEEVKRQLGSMISIGNKDSIDILPTYDTRSTGFAEFDIGNGTGGYLKSKIYEWYGPEHVGKTFVCMMAIIWNQVHYGGRSLWTDTEEHAFDSKWFTNLGGRLDLLDIYRPELRKQAGEKSMEGLVNLIRYGNYEFAVLDSLKGPQIMPSKVLEKEIGDSEQMALRAKINNEFFDKIAIVIALTGTTFLYTNHLAKSIGAMFAEETSSGGQRRLHLCDGRFKLNKPSDSGYLKGVIKKQKRAPVAGSSFEIGSSFIDGPDNYKHVMDKCLEFEIITSRKNYLVYKGVMLKNKKEWEEKLRGNIKLYDTLIKDIIRITSPVSSTGAFETDDEDEL